MAKKISSPIHAGETVKYKMVRFYSVSVYIIYVQCDSFFTDTSSCSKNYHCLLSSKTISLFNVCDDFFDCPNSDDERFCDFRYHPQRSSCCVFCH